MLTKASGSGDGLGTIHGHAMDCSNNFWDLVSSLQRATQPDLDPDAADLGYNRQVGPLEKNDHVNKLSNSPAR
jgi:hypothetical protein